MCVCVCVCDSEEARAKIISLFEQKKSDSTQKRLERIWTLLRMSDTAKLDMAIKYSTNEYVDKLAGAVNDWEAAANLIAERERHIYQLEQFERAASDPNRFFARNQRGSSVARLEEAQQRDLIYKSIDAVQPRIERIVTAIEKRYGDTVTYSGRAYLDKMRWDRVEMLHFLTEERRLKFIKNEIKTNPAAGAISRIQL